MERSEMAEESPRDKARHAPREGHASRHPYLNTPHTRWRETRAGIGGGRRRLEGACERASGEAGRERERERIGKMQQGGSTSRR